MNDNNATHHFPGVYCTLPTGETELVHEYSEAEYGLDDIHVMFGLGQLESTDEALTLTLSDSEIRQLKVIADAQSFDHPEDFIAMCLDIHRFTEEQAGGPYRFRAVS